jgi:hypothetical protein
VEALLKTPCATFKVEAATPKDMFKAIAQTQEIFCEEKCGLCSKNRLRYVVREVKGNEFPELHCLDCRAKLVFGYSKAKPGQMFPIRKLTEEGKPCRKTGKPGKHNGWTKHMSNVEPEVGEE